MTERTRIVSMLLLVALAGCSGHAPAQTLTAAEIASSMATTLGDQVSGVTVLTERSDVNHLLGRPDGYTSAAVLDDATLSPTDSPGVDHGATVEVWPSSTAAADRAAAIHAILEGAGGVLGSEYDVRDGAVLLRISGDLAPSVEREYVAAFESAR